MNYKRAKKKYFRKRVDTWILFYKQIPVLRYSKGLFNQPAFHKECDYFVKLAMFKSDTDAFWFVHKLRIMDDRYYLRYSNDNYSVTFTTTKS